MEFQRSFTASDIRDRIEGDTPSKRTVRNTLNAMEEMGHLRSEGGAGRAPRVYYPAQRDVAEMPPGYSPRSGSHSSTIPYPGGKGNLSDWIVDNMPAHDTYVEVFGGAAGVLYNKPLSKYEIYNDQNEDLTQFFSVLRDQPGELAEWLQSVPYSRSVYKEWVTEFYNGFRPENPVERAGRYFSLRYMQYVGESSSPNGFKTRAKRSPARTFDNARKRLDSLAQRFAQVTIENRDYRKILDQYDDTSVDVLFYLDPPYVGAEDYYGCEFDHEAFVDCLHDVEGDWLVSYSTLPDGLDDYTVIERQSRHRMARSTGNVSERLVINFDPNERRPFRSRELQYP